MLWNISFLDFRKANGCGARYTPLKALLVHPSPLPLIPTNCAVDSGHGTRDSCPRCAQRRNHRCLASIHVVRPCARRAITAVVSIFLRCSSARLSSPRTSSHHARTQSHRHRLALIHADEPLHGELVRRNLYIVPGLYISTHLAASRPLLGSSSHLTTATSRL